MRWLYSLKAIQFHIAFAVIAIIFISFCLGSRAEFQKYLPGNDWGWLLLLLVVGYPIALFLLWIEQRDSIQVTGQSTDLNKRQSHLEYSSVASWMHGEAVPNGFVLEYGSGRRPDFKVYVDQYCELRQDLFDNHLKTLSTEIQQQLKTGQHPSQSHSKGKQVEPVLQRLKDLLAGLDFVKDVSIKYAQLNLVQFDVMLEHEPSFEQANTIPDFIEGFVINPVWKLGT